MKKTFIIITIVIVVAAIAGIWYYKKNQAKISEELKTRKALDDLQDKDLDKLQKELDALKQKQIIKKVSAAQLRPMYGIVPIAGDGRGDGNANAGDGRG